MAIESFDQLSCKSIPDDCGILAREVIEINYALCGRLSARALCDEFGHIVQMVYADDDIVATTAERVRAEIYEEVEGELGELAITQPAPRMLNALRAQLLRNLDGAFVEL